MTTPRFRKPKPFGSRSEISGVSDPKKSFYIFCEGEKTEKEYFNGVFNHRVELNINQLIDIIVIEQEEGKKHIPHPKHIVDGCVKLINSSDEAKTDLLNYDSSIDEIWVIFDRDPKTFLEDQYNYVYNKCEEHRINIGFTNPNFEFWLLLHLPNIKKYKEEILLSNDRVGGKNSKRFVEKELSNRLEGGYSKKDIKFERFCPNIELAIEQEKLFKQEVHDISKDVGSNIGTLISKLKES